MGATLVSEEWTEARIEQLKSLWADGLSCTQIATAMGGTTRNAVIGKVHRLKLDRRRPSTNRYGRKAVTKRQMQAGRKMPRTIPKPRQIEPDIAPEQFEFSASAWQPLPGSIPVTMEFMTGCKWPVGNPYGTDMALFCNCVPMEGKPYCREHTERSIGMVFKRPPSAAPARRSSNNIRLLEREWA
jgi:GcrA cell cycle regulator